MTRFRGLNFGFLAFTTLLGASAATSCSGELTSTELGSSNFPEMPGTSGTSGGTPSSGGSSGGSPATSTGGVAGSTGGTLASGGSAGASGGLAGAAGAGGAPSTSSGGMQNTGGASGAGGSASGGTSGGAGFGGMPGGSSGAGGDGGTPQGGSQNGGSGAGGSSGGASGGTSSSGGTPSIPMITPIQNGMQGWASRYWDCCKPHCGWANNVPSRDPMNSCSQSDDVLSNDDVGSACDGGGAFMCHSLAPWAVSNNISFGYIATSAHQDICGRCFQIQFTGSGHHNPGDPGSQSLNGKTMLVQAINVGNDVDHTQFDLLIPGGGVGKFNACSQQWGTSDLGQQYGGFLASCKQQNPDHNAAKNCVLNRCRAVFESKGFTELMDGCRWFVEWFNAADNPNFVYKEIECPEELIQRSGMRR
ncbi:MAG: endoglucanase [Pseudomonadota bacterium]